MVESIPDKLEFRDFHIYHYRSAQQCLWGGYNQGHSHHQWNNAKVSEKDTKSTFDLLQGVIRLARKSGTAYFNLNAA